MIIHRNEKLIKRNSRIAQFTMLGGLLVLGIGIFVSFRYPEQVSLTFGALIFGFLLSQIGIYFSNRWGRRPRPDEILDAALKGLDSKYALYHYETPTPHLLVGPAGVWVLMPYYQRGRITYSGGRWRQKNTGLGQLYMRIFAQEGLGRPDLEVAHEVETIQRFLASKLQGVELPPVRAALVFSHEQAEIDIPADENPPAETVLAKDLKELIRKFAKQKVLSLEKVKTIQDALGGSGSVQE